MFIRKLGSWAFMLIAVKLGFPKVGHGITNTIDDKLVSNFVKGQSADIFYIHVLLPCLDAGTQIFVLRAYRFPFSVSMRLLSLLSMSCKYGLPCVCSRGSFSVVLFGCAMP